MQKAPLQKWILPLFFAAHLEKVHKVPWRQSFCRKNASISFFRLITCLFCSIWHLENPLLPLAQKKVQVKEVENQKDFFRLFLFVAAYLSPGRAFGQREGDSFGGGRCRRGRVRGRLHSGLAVLAVLLRRHPRADKVRGFAPGLFIEQGRRKPPPVSYSHGRQERRDPGGDEGPEPTHLQEAFCAQEEFNSCNRGFRHQEA